VTTTIRPTWRKKPWEKSATRRRRAPDPDVCVTAVRNYGISEIPRALGKLGDKRAIEPLREALQSAASKHAVDLRSAAFESLLMLKAPGIYGRSDCRNEAPVLSPASSTRSALS